MPLVLEVQLNINDLVYYLSGFMNVILSNSIDLNKPLNILRWYDILDADTNYTDELSKELNNKQLRMIALFLCFDPRTKEIDLSKPPQDDDSTFAKFWYPFLK